MIAVARYRSEGGPVLWPELLVRRNRTPPALAAHERWRSWLCAFGLQFATTNCVRIWRKRGYGYPPNGKTPGNSGPASNRAVAHLLIELAVAQAARHPGAFH